MKNFTNLLNLTPKDAAMGATMFLIAQAGELIPEPYTQLAQGLIAFGMLALWTALERFYPDLTAEEVTPVTQTGTPVEGSQDGNVTFEEWVNQLGD